MKKILLIMVILISGCSADVQEKSENIKIVEETMQEDQTLIDIVPGYTNFQHNIKTDFISDTLESTASYSIDVSDPKILLEDFEKEDDSKTIIANVTIGNIYEAIYLENRNSYPYTSADVVEYEIIYGDDVNGLDKIYFGGGIVSNEEYIKTHPDDSEKSGLRAYDDDGNRLYSEIILDSSYDYQPGGSYILILNERDGIWSVAVEGYGTFLKSKSSNLRNVSDTLSNVLTGEILELEDN